MSKGNDRKKVATSIAVLVGASAEVLEDRKCPEITGMSQR
jgi:hypothetical protein